MRSPLRLNYTCFSADTRSRRMLLSLTGLASGGMSRGSPRPVAGAASGSARRVPDDGLLHRIVAGRIGDIAADGAELRGRDRHRDIFGAGVLREALPAVAKLEPLLAADDAINGFAVRALRPLGTMAIAVPRCTIERLMRDLGLEVVIRGKPVRATISAKSALWPLDQVNRQFHAPAPNMLWMSDFAYVATWAGFICAAFIIDVYARYIVGWRVSKTAHATLAAPLSGSSWMLSSQAIDDRLPVHHGGLVHQSDRSS